MGRNYFSTKHLTGEQLFFLEKILVPFMFMQDLPTEHLIIIEGVLENGHYGDYERFILNECRNLYIHKMKNNPK